MKPSSSLTVSSYFTDDELLSIRYLNDLLFCERRAALHINEQLWVHNRYTVEGTHAHQRVDRSRDSKTADGRTAHSLWLVSRRLGLIGKADTVEFLALENLAAPPQDDAPESQDETRCTSEPKPSADSIRGLVPYPVEFKRGRRRQWDRDDVQLCAQALCLEEMLGVAVPRGAIFHVKSKRRREVVFDDTLRELTEQTVHRLRELVALGRTPSAKYQKKCDDCSLNELCLPRALRPRATAARYLQQLTEIPPDADETVDNPADQP